jgi:hypothetical protein
VKSTFFLEIFMIVIKQKIFAISRLFRTYNFSNCVNKKRFSFSRSKYQNRRKVLIPFAKRSTSFWRRQFPLTFKTAFLV